MQPEDSRNTDGGPGIDGLRVLSKGVRSLSWVVNALCLVQPESMVSSSLWDEGCISSN